MLFIKIWLIKVAATYAIWRLLTPEKRRAVKDYGWRLFGFHDSSGLKYSSKQLRKAFDKIIYWPIEKQARYADKVCKDMVRDRIETRTMLEGAFRHFPTFNTTSVGNIAYLARYSYDKRVKQQAFKILQDYIQWRNA